MIGVAPRAGEEPFEPAPVPRTTGGPGLGQRIDAWMSGYPDTAAQRALHKAPVALWRLGLGPVVGRPFMLLTTTGRSSGLPRRTPLAAHRIAGRLYAWDPYGERSRWWQNLVAHPVVTVQDATGAWTARAVRLDNDPEASEVHRSLKQFDARLFREYCDRVGIDDSEAAFVALRDRLHVVRLEPSTEPGPPALKADLAWAWVVVVVTAVGLLAVVRPRG